MCKELGITLAQRMSSPSLTIYVTNSETEPYQMPQMADCTVGWCLN
jgi:hypothetical protein